MVDIPFQHALDLARQIRYRKISSVELTTHYLDRLERDGPRLNALVTLTRDLALAQAQQFDHDLARGHVRSALHGVPYGIKDLFSTRGIPTTWGSNIYRERIIDHDAAVVVRLRNAGCPLIGKLSMVEFAGSVGYRYASASATGPGLNPWNLDHWSGGSSSGSAAATAAGLVGFAIGTETWGSILCPSAFCGVTGLRPTSGRVSRDGAMALSWTMDKIGPIARSVDDAAAVLQIIAGPEGTDAQLRPAREANFRAPNRYASVSRLRVAVVRPDYGAGAGVQPETETVFEGALRVIEGFGAEVFDLALPQLPMDEIASTIVEAEGASAFEDIARNESLWSQVIDPEERGGLIASLEIPAVDYIRSLRIRGLAQLALQDVFSRCDVLVAPSYLQTAPPITANLDTFFAGSDGKIGSMSNMLGLPAIGVPMGFGAGNLPLGLQIVGPPLGEAAILALAREYQKATGWSDNPPALFADASARTVK